MFADSEAGVAADDSVGLLDKNAVPKAVYDKIKDEIIAKQKQTASAEPISLLDRFQQVARTTDTASFVLSAAAQCLVHLVQESATAEGKTSS